MLHAHTRVHKATPTILMTAVAKHTAVPAAASAARSSPAQLMIALQRFRLAMDILQVATTWSQMQSVRSNAQADTQDQQHPKIQTVVFAIDVDTVGMFLVVTRALMECLKEL